jgi:peptidoglycan/LPS O-acetylase OafA/YrhL
MAEGRADLTQRLDDGLLSPVAPSRADAKFPNIDGLRAIAALSVVLCHTVGVSSILNTGWGSYLSELRAGVQIFFVISGFVLYGPFARAHLVNRRGPGLVGYFKRRLFRIFPAYWVVLTIGALSLHVIFFGDFSNKLENYALVQSYFPAFFTGLQPAWTLVIEIAFYIMLPIYATALWHLGRRGRARSEFVGVSLLFVAGLLFSAWTSFSNPPIFITVLPANLAPFALGMFLAVVHSWAERRTESPRWIRSLGAHPGVLWLVAAVAWSSIVWGVHYPSNPGLFKLPGLQLFEYALLLDILGFCIVAPMVLGNQTQGRIRRGLQLRPVVFLGTISYAIYLWHDPVMYKVENIAQRLHMVHGQLAFNFFAITGLTLAVTIPLAIASWFIIEKPFIQLSRLGARKYVQSLRTRLPFRSPATPLAIVPVMGDDTTEAAVP